MKRSHPGGSDADYGNALDGGSDGSERATPQNSGLFEEISGASAEYATRQGSGSGSSNNNGGASNSAPPPPVAGFLQVNTMI